MTKSNDPPNNYYRIKRPDVVAHLITDRLRDAVEAMIDCVVLVANGDKDGGRMAYEAATMHHERAKRHSYLLGYKWEEYERTEIPDTYFEEQPAQREAEVESSDAVRRHARDGDS